MIRDEGFEASQLIAKRLSEIPNLNVTPYMRDLIQGIDRTKLEGSVGVMRVSPTSTSGRGSQMVTWSLDIIIPSGFSSTREGDESEAEKVIMTLASYDPELSILGKIRAHRFEFALAQNGQSRGGFTVNITESFERAYRVSDADSVKEHVLSVEMTAII